MRRTPGAAAAGARPDDVGRDTFDPDRNPDPDAGRATVCASDDEGVTAIVWASGCAVPEPDTGGVSMVWSSGLTGLGGGISRVSLSCSLIDLGCSDYEERAKIGQAGV
jgi:hypothetical protein